MKKLFNIFLIIALLIPAISMAEWTGPSSQPPLNNVPAPINVGQGSQTKIGTIGAYEFCLYSSGGLKLSCLGASTGGTNSFPWVINGTNVENSNLTGKVYIKDSGVTATVPTEKLTVDGGVKATKFCIGTTCLNSFAGLSGGGDVVAGTQAASSFTKWGNGTDKTINRATSLSEDSSGNLCLGVGAAKACISDWTKVVGVGGPAGVAGIPGVVGSDGKILSCTTGKILKWNGAWTCGDDLTGTGGIGSVLAGVGSGITVAADGRTVSLNNTGCSAGYVLKWNGTAWACAADASGITSTPANGGLSTSGSVISLMQCPSGKILKAGATLGTWACQDDAVGVTSTPANGGLSTSGSVISLMQCPSGQILKAGTTAGTWACAADNIGVTGGVSKIVAGAGVSVSPVGGIGDVTVALPTCLQGQVLKAGVTAGTWSCQSDGMGSMPVSGTVNKLVKFTGSGPSTVGDSNLSDDGTYVTNSKPIKTTGGLIIQTTKNTPTNLEDGMIWLCTDTGPVFCNGDGI